VSLNINTKIIINEMWELKDLVKLIIIERACLIKLIVTDKVCCINMK